MNNYLIICNGGINDYIMLSERLAEIEYNYVVTVDGGINHARKMKIPVNTAIGDFDSISPDDADFLEKNGIQRLTYPSDKDKTDSELAIDFCITRNADSIIIAAYNGSRLDHSLANILMFAAKSQIIPITLASENNIAHYVHNHIILEAPSNCYVSIIPITESITVERTTGLHYELRNTRLRRGETVGVSNYAVDTRQEIYILNGIALVTVSRD